MCVRHSTCITKVIHQETDVLLQQKFSWLGTLDSHLFFYAFDSRHMDGVGVSAYL